MNQEGYYWVYSTKFNAWIIAEYDGIHWFAAGWEEPIDDTITEKGDMITRQLPSAFPTPEELLAKYTERELHDMEMHPHYMYITTQTGRKSGEEGRPEGEGWEPNNKVKAGGLGESLRRNWIRYDYFEDNFWMKKMP